MRKCILWLSAYFQGNPKAMQLGGIHCNLHNLLEPLRIFAQNFNTNCPSFCAIRRCKNIAEKFHPLSRAHKC